MNTTDAPADECTDEYKLAAAIDSLGPDDEPGGYEKLRARVVAAHGQEEADRLFDLAHAHLGHEYAIEAAQFDLAQALAAAERALRDAARALDRLTGPDAWHVEYAEGTQGRDIRAHLEEAALRVRAADAVDHAIRPSGLTDAVRTGTRPQPPRRP